MKGKTPDPELGQCRMTLTNMCDDSRFLVTIAIVLHVILAVWCFVGHPHVAACETETVLVHWTGGFCVFQVVYIGVLRFAFSEPSGLDFTPGVFLWH